MNNIRKSCWLLVVAVACLVIILSIVRHRVMMDIDRTVRVFDITPANQPTTSSTVSVPETPAAPIELPTETVTTNIEGEKLAPQPQDAADIAKGNDSQRLVPGSRFTKQMNLRMMMK